MADCCCAGGGKRAHRVEIKLGDTSGHRALARTPSAWPAGKLLTWGSALMATRLARTEGRGAATRGAVPALVGTATEALRKARAIVKVVFYLIKEPKLKCLYGKE
eukprot:scaffold219253_cov16-Tisochrysis_lutea.AAC.1